MKKPFHLMTPSERTALRIVQNREIAEKNAETLTLLGPSYQTAQLYEYRPILQRQAVELFQCVQARVGNTKTSNRDGSYSILHSKGFHTAAKIVIYENGLGKRRGDWPSLCDGIYVLIRANGRVGDKIWKEIPEIADHTRTLGIAPNHSERYAYFRTSGHDNNNRYADVILKAANAHYECGE